MAREYSSFELASEDLVDGKWADVISATSKGENLSPSSCTGNNVIFYGYLSVTFTH